MALLSKRGRFKTGTGGFGTLVPVTGLGFQPKALLFHWNGRTETVDTAGNTFHQKGIGFAIPSGPNVCVTASSQHNSNPANTHHDMHESRAIFTLTATGGNDGEMILDSVNGDGFNMKVIDAFAADLTVEFMAWGGSDISNASVVSFQEPVSAGVQNVDSVGFPPDAIFFISNASGAATMGITADSIQCFGIAAGGGTIRNYCHSGGSDNGVSPSQTVSYCRSGESIGVVSSDLTALNSRGYVSARRPSGFELTWNEVPGNGQRETFALCIKGGLWYLGDFLSSTDLADKVVGGFGFGQAPRGGIVVSHCNSHSVQDVANTGDERSFGMFNDANDEWAMAYEDVDNLSASRVQTAYEDKVYAGCNSVGGLDARVGVKSVGVDSLTFEQINMDANNRFIWFLVWADSAKHRLIHRGNVLGGVLTP